MIAVSTDETNHHISQAIPQLILKWVVTTEKVGQEEKL